MRYSYEYKKKCVELYQQGVWPETPEGIKDASNFHNMIRRWVRIAESNGLEALQHKNFNKIWSPEQKLELISRVLAGKSIQEVSFSEGMTSGLLHRWVRKYKIYGYNGLIDKKKGRKPKNPDMNRLNINKPRKLKESEYEELIRLRAENEYIKAENEVIKKRIALRQEKEAARLKAKKQQSSKSSEKKDIN
jgi:transposase-like protein